MDISMCKYIQGAEDMGQFERVKIYFSTAKFCLAPTSKLGSAPKVFLGVIKVYIPCSLFLGHLWLSEVCSSIKKSLVLSMYFV